jgi:murein DD-endopeptidase MepM/ murein hydrolase activator NlpD
MYTGSAVIRFTRRFVKETRPMWSWFQRQYKDVVADSVALFIQKVRGVIYSFRLAFSAPRTPFKTDAKKSILEFFGCFSKVICRHPTAFSRLVHLAAPVLAAFILMWTLQYWNAAQFGIRVAYDGVDIGYISDESIYHAAAALARDRVYSEDNTFTISDTPRMKVALVKQSNLQDQSALCDQILRTQGDAISEATGLYVNGVFAGSMRSRAQLVEVLQEIKSTYRSDAKNERAEFIQKVEMVDGLFLSDSLMNKEKMKEKLVAQAVVKKEYTVQKGDTLSTIARKLDMTISDLRAMNPSVKNDTIYADQILMVQRPQPFLRVKVVRTIEYTEELPFTIEKQYDKNKYQTYEKVLKQGKKGSQNVTAEVTFVDGVEQSRTILSMEVTKQPVTKVVLVGTKPVVNSSGGNITVGDGVTHGNMVWPVPICRNMSRGYRAGHYALDICNGPVTVRNKPFIAADGGTVTFAGWNSGGYGYMVRIRHDNGLQTLYAHCNALYVVTGQKVTRGQTLGLIGSTGRSSGPHLHFEVIKNGRRVNPLNYVSRY